MKRGAKMTSWPSSDAPQRWPAALAMNVVNPAGLECATSAIDVTSI